MEVIAINRSEACAILDNGTIIHFALMLDIHQDETDDVSEAVVAVAPLPDGNWTVIDFSKFETVSVH
jgi:hypothetical protein